MKVPFRLGIRDADKLPTAEEFAEADEKRSGTLRRAGLSAIADHESRIAHADRIANQYQEISGRWSLWREHLPETLSNETAHGVKLETEALAHLNKARTSDDFNQVETWMNRRTGEFMVVGIVLLHWGRRTYCVYQWSEKKGGRPATTKALCVRRARWRALIAMGIALPAMATIYLLGAVLGGANIALAALCAGLVLSQSKKPRRLRLNKAFYVFVLTLAAVNAIVVGVKAAEAAYNRTSTTTAVVCTVDSADDGYNYPVRTTKGTFKVPTELLPNDLYEGDKVAITHRKLNNAVKGVEVTEHHYGRPPTYPDSCK